MLGNPGEVNEVDSFIFSLKIVTFDIFFILRSPAQGTIGRSCLGLRLPARSIRTPPEVEAPRYIPSSLVKSFQSAPQKRGQGPISKA
jgi:hypothetical protein